MHVAVFADMEGSFGIWRKSQCLRGKAEWQYGRVCLTADVNSVIQGAFDGGAARVTVRDTHDTGFNCIRKALDPRAGYQGGPYVRPTIFGSLSGYDLILYVAIHAASGTGGAFFPHTHFGEFSELRLNGKPLSEMELYGGCFAEHGIPIGFASGEDIAIQQARASLPWLKTVSVSKEKNDYTDGERSLAYLSQGRARLREQAAEAVRAADRMRLLRYQGELGFEAVFSSEDRARRYNTWGLERKGAVIRWQSASMCEGLDTINKLTWFPRAWYPYLPFMLFLFRRFYQIKNNYFPPRCESEGAAMIGQVCTGPSCKKPPGSS